MSVPFYLLTLILSVTTCIQACCLIFRMEVKSECSPSHHASNFPQGHILPSLPQRAWQLPKKTHYFYLATDISFITLIVLLSFEQRDWCGLYYMGANS